MTMTAFHGPLQYPPMFGKGAILRGELKMVILTILQDRPMHGYEISRIIAEKSHGFYKPSAGSIYPALRSLLETGCIKSRSEGRRKMYQITSKGRRLIVGRKEEIERCMRAFRESLGPDRSLLMEELAKTGKLIALASRSITPEQARALAKVVEEAREKMLRIISE